MLTTEVLLAQVDVNWDAVTGKTILGLGLSGALWIARYLGIEHLKMMREDRNEARNDLALERKARQDFEKQSLAVLQELAGAMKSLQDKHDETKAVIEEIREHMPAA